MYVCMYACMIGWRHFLEIEDVQVQGWLPVNFSKKNTSSSRGSLTEGDTLLSPAPLWVWEDISMQDD